MPVAAQPSLLVRADGPAGQTEIIVVQAVRHVQDACREGAEECLADVRRQFEHCAHQTPGLVQHFRVVHLISSREPAGMR